MHKLRLFQTYHQNYTEFTPFSLYIYIKSSQSELYTLSVSAYVYIHNQIWEPDLAFVSKRDFFCARERFASLLRCVLFFFFFVLFFSSLCVRGRNWNNFRFIRENESAITEVKGKNNNGDDETTRTKCDSDENDDIFLKRRRRRRRKRFYEDEEDNEKVEVQIEGTTTTTKGGIGERTTPPAKEDDRNKNKNKNNLLKIVRDSNAKIFTARSRRAL